MNDMLKEVTQQATQDVLAVYEGLRKAIEAPVSDRDVVAATLTVAVFNRLEQSANSLD